MKKVESMENNYTTLQQERSFFTQKEICMKPIKNNINNSNKMQFRNVLQ